MKCPNCGNEIYAIDTLDNDCSGDSYFDFVEGTCRNCGKSWRQIEVFTFDHYEDIEEIKENDHP